MFAPVCRGGPWPSRGGTRQGRPGRYGIGPYMGCLRRRGVCGRGMPLPYMPSGNDRPNGIATAARANVGRDALIPPGPAAAGMFPVLNFNGAAGVNARPTDRGNTAATRENTIPAVHRRGGFHIRPVRGGAGFAGGINPAPTGKFCVSGKPGGRDVCPGLQGRGMPLPYMPSGNDRPNGIAAAARANVGRDALVPPGPAAA